MTTETQAITVGDVVVDPHMRLYTVIARPMDPKDESYWVAAVPQLDIEAYGHGEADARANLDRVLEVALAERRRRQTYE